MSEIKVLEVNVDDKGLGGVYSLVKNIIEKKPDNMKLDIAALELFDHQENVDALNKKNCDVYHVGHENKIIKQFCFYTKMKKLLLTHKYDYVHIHGDIANKLFPLGLAAKHAGVKHIVFHSHSAGVEGKGRHIKLFLHYLMRDWIRHIGTDFVSCSDNATKWMFPNVDENKVILINNGVELSKFRYNTEVRDAVRKELKLEDAFVIGHVGRFSYAKNHEYLLRVFKAVKGHVENAKLLLIGDGPLFDETIALAKELEIADDAIFYGLSNRVAEFFQGMDIVLLPSRFEGLPIVGVEAQAAGLPVIFSEGITKTAKLVDTVSYLPIEEDSIPKWVDEIEKYTKYQRVDYYDELKARKFDLSDTVNAFIELYQNP